VTTFRAAGGALKTQEWKTRHELAGAENAGAEKTGVENAGVEKTGVKNVARRKTQVLYVKVFEKVSALVAQFVPSCAVATVADFQEASVSAFHHVCQSREH